MLLQEIILHLSLIQDIGPTVVAKLIDSIGLHQLEKVYECTVADFMLYGCSQQKAELLYDGLKSKAVLEQEYQLMQRYNVSIVTIACDDYPKLLRQIHVPPLVLYFQGDRRLFAHQKNLACVGARKAHSYVDETLRHLVVPLIKDGWIIVSGGALGADTYAHSVAVEYHTPTIVVVGSGLCHVYPPSNKKLFDRVVACGGLIVSCFAMSVAPEPHCFPIRNRIISGLSVGCLVLQAAQKSGALITAECALNQGREVFAVPGSIFDPLSAGCHYLIAQGAKLVTSVHDILDELGSFSHNAGVDVQQTLLMSHQGGIQEAQDQSVVSINKSKTVSRVRPKSSDDFDGLKGQILQQVVVPVSADMLLGKLKIDLATLQGYLFDLSLEGKIAQDGMGFWKRV